MLFNDRRAGEGLKDVSDFTKMTKDKTLSRQRTLQRMQPMTTPAPRSDPNATSQRVLDAWKKRAG